MSGRCACHRNVGTCTWRTIDGRMTGEFAGDRHHVTCDACGRWLPLGPSDETPERVALEIRAAELSIGRDTLNICEHCEVCGWLAHKDDLHHEPQAHHVDDEFHAGYLARVIATHKETP